MKKANKSVYVNACELYKAICLNPGNQILLDQINHLMEEYDFDNEIITDANGKKGLALCTGAVVVAPHYDNLKIVYRSSIPLQPVIAIGIRDGMECLIELTGEELFIADELCPEMGYLGAMLAFRTGNKWGVATSKGTSILIPPTMDKIEWGGNDFIFFLKDGKWGIYTPLGETIAPRFDEVGWDECDNLSVVLNGEKGYLDMDLDFTTEKDECAYDIYTGRSYPFNHF